MSKVRLVVLGAGLIGARHAEIIKASRNAELAAIADPAESGRALAARLDVAHFVRWQDAVAAEGIDGVVNALPNQLHEPAALACIARGLPSIVEKPLADTLEAGARIVEASERAGVAVLVGHHRRYNPIVEAAKALIDAGRLGRIVGASGIWANLKPDHYYQATWRRTAGGGPILINVIHDVDCLRHLIGEISSITAFTGNAVRGFEVEDTAAVAVRFATGALAAMTLTDAAPSPWGWEQGSGDNPGIATSGAGCLRIVGTEAALDFPNMVLWRIAPGQPRSWSEPVVSEQIAIADGEALPRQIDHFAGVIRGEVVPRITARDGFLTLSATLAIKEAAAQGMPVTPRGL